MRIFLWYYLCHLVNCYFDYELHHNLTADAIRDAESSKIVSAPRAKVETFAMHGFGRVLTWNVKKLGACLKQDNVEQLKEVVCVILQSANVIVLQETENLDLSCLPCNNALKEEYEWPADDDSKSDFKILIKTKHSHSFKVNKMGKCDSEETAKKKSNLDNPKIYYQTVMRALQMNSKKARQSGTYRNVTDEKPVEIQLMSENPETKSLSSYNVNLPTFEADPKTPPSGSDSNSLSKNYSSSFPSNEKSHNFRSQGKSLRINLRFHLLNDSSSSNEQNGPISPYLEPSSEQKNAELPGSVSFTLPPVGADESQSNASSANSNKMNRFAPEPNSSYQASYQPDNDVVNSRFVSKMGDKNDSNHEERFQSENTSDTNHNFETDRTIQEQLLKDVAKLNDSTAEERKSEKFRSISDQLKNIEKEIDNMHDKENSFQNRFHANESTKSMNHVIESGVSKSDVVKWKARLTLPTTNEERVDRFHDNNIGATSISNTVKLENGSSPENTYSDASETYSKRNDDNNPLSDIDLDSEKMHHLVNEVLLEPKLKSFNNEYKNDELLENVLTHHKFGKHKLQNLDQPKYKRSMKRTGSSKKKLRAVRNKKNRRVKTTNAMKRTDVVEPRVKINYVITTVTSDLNSGSPFLVANVKLPKDKTFQRQCFEKIMADISNANSEVEQKFPVFIMGDFHFDQLTGADDRGEMYKLVNNLQIDSDNYHAPIIYSEKDPVTTVYGRRFDNIVTNINLKGNLKTIGPDLPVEPEPIILPLTLQRLYNNYMTALYSSDGGESDSIYECIKAFQLAGKSELDNVVCKDSWVPSSYISDHLPLQVKVKIKVPGKSSPVEINIASWNIQGDTFKERLIDTAVRKQFLSLIKKFHVAVFHDFPAHDRIVSDDELGTGDIVRLRQDDITTDFGIYVNENAKDGDSDMFVLRKKFKDEQGTDTTLDGTSNIITTVGLFTPKLVIDTVKIRPCLYVIKTSALKVDFNKIMKAIQKDESARKCDFKILLGSMNLDENFDIDKEIYKNYKYINMKCRMTDGQNKYAYNIPRSRDLADYVIMLNKDDAVQFDECTIGLPGDELKRGIDKVSDFEEISTHYPFSIVVKKPEI